MKFYTWANNLEDERLYEIKKSAERYNIPLEFLGVGINPFNNFQKSKLLYNALKELDDNEIVCAVDAFDVFFQNDAESIEKKFITNDCHILYAVERGYSQQYEKYKGYYDKLNFSSPYRYVNAGTIIGYAYALKIVYSTPLHLKLIEIINHSPGLVKKFRKPTNSFRKRVLKQTLTQPALGQYAPWYFISDQTVLGRNLALNPKHLDIKADYQTDLYWCAAFEWDNIGDHFYLHNGKIFNSHTRRDPPIIHVPFESKYRSVFKMLFERTL